MFATSRRFFFVQPSNDAHPVIDSPQYALHLGRVLSHRLGQRSEQIACDYLRARGWRVIERNYRAGHKEIDIIARRANTIAFVEVKARAAEDHGHPLEAITWSKRRDIAHVARSWLRTNRSEELEYRFDAIAIHWRGQAHVIEHVENAWLIK